jgi:serine/threonine-protein kinase
LLRGGLDEGAQDNGAAAPRQSEAATHYVFGDFEIARREDGSFWELGAGAMGVTYRAVDKVLHRTVALKVIETPAVAGKSQIVRERFLREARAAAALKHPNVAGIFQFGASPEIDRCYYAMELVEGETLEALVRREGPLKMELALEIAIQVTRALVAAAAQSLIHRDLKPGNIMITRPDAAMAEMEVKVIDFGLAKITNAVAETELTHGGFVGTPSFASPEQFGGGPADARSDIYSLGITLWYALTGQVPYPGKTIEEIRDRQQKCDLPVEQLAERKIPAPLIEILRRTLALDPTRRPASAREMLAALESRRSSLAMPQAFIRRERVRKLAALIVTLAIVAAIPVAFLLWRQQTRVAANAAMPLAEKSIAVLPFENLSDDKQNAYFAAGVQDELLSDLARIADLKVISRTSVMRYKNSSERNLHDIGQALGVTHIVEGSVQRVGNRLRVNAQLVDTRTDAHLWAQTYDGELVDIFGIQSEIAQRIADQLRVKISATEKAAILEQPTTDLTAYALYTEAKAASAWADWKKERIKPRLLELLHEAIRRDPNFVLAYCSLAEVYSWEHGTAQRTGYESPEVDELWKQAIDNAMRLRPDLGEPHVALARYHLFLNHFDAARDELVIARRLLPNNSEALFIAARIDRRQNRWEESLIGVRKAHQLDPRNPDIIAWVSEMYRLMRRYSEGEQFVSEAMARMPEITSWLNLQLAELKLREGDPRAAQEIVARVPPATGGGDVRFNTALYLRDYDTAAKVIATAPAEEAVEDFDGKPPRSLADGQLARARGDKTAAEAAFLGARGDWEDPNAHHRRDEQYFTEIALLDAGLGRKQEAIREAQHAVELLPISQDALFGPVMVRNLAWVYAWTGEPNLAIEKLEMLSKIPNDLSYGDLRFNPCWDSLRGDPRFDKIVASLKPKKIDS